MLRYFRRQSDEVFEGGLSVLLRKGRTLATMALVALLVLLVRLVRPVVTVRFGALQSGRIGHFAVNTELYLCERDAGMHHGRTVDVFYHGVRPCNRQLDKMWRRKLRLHQFAKRVDRLNRRLPGASSHAVPVRRYQDRDIHGLIGDTEPHLEFTPQEERLGKQALRDLGIPDGAPFICFHVRDPAYLDATYSYRTWDYHDYRNSSIRNFLPAVEELTRRGYFAIRMGAIVKEALSTAEPKIIDYATKSRTDFLDIYLSAKCQFFIGGPTGLFCVPLIFRRPVANVNWLPLNWARSSNPTELFIPKKLWLRQEHRYMTFREILDSPVGTFSRTEEYDGLDIDVIENTPEEITELALEVDDRHNGAWSTNAEDAELQTRFWALFRQGELHRVIRAHIGADFLRQNQDLLG